MIPEEVIREIRDRSDIVAVIGQHVQLRKAGRNHKGLCPFHGEKTPSFNVNPERGFFYCFGCQKKGDVFTFVMEYEGKSFHEAAEQLARLAGVTIPEVEEPEEARRSRSERARMLEVNKLAARFYAELLRAPAGAPGRTYLDRRGIGAEMIEAFQLGYAPGEWRSLTDQLRRHKAPVDAAVATGLLVPQQQRGPGHFYDRFRDRLMCPVIVPGGEVVGFSGRLLESSQDTRRSTLPQGSRSDPGGGAAKYINSPESPIYKKSKLLFGLHRARDAFHRTGRAILVEGNFDVISLHQAGFAETVAPLGTALTDQQVDQLRRLTEKVILFYDGDKAGRAATLRALGVLLAAGLDVRIARLPAGDDPDSLVRRDGAAGLTAVLEHAKPAFDYFLQEVWGEQAGTLGEARVLEEAADLLARIEDQTKRELMARRIEGQLAARAGVDVATIRRALARGTAPDRRPQDGGPTPEARPAAPAAQPPDEELAILAILADHPDLIEIAEQKGTFSLLTDARLRDMYSAAREGRPMVSAISADLGPAAARVLSGDYSHRDPARNLIDAIAVLEHVRTRHKLAELNRRLEMARRRDDADLVRQVIGEIRMTRKQVD